MLSKFKVGLVYLAILVVASAVGLAARRQNLSVLKAGDTERQAAVKRGMTRSPGTNPIDVCSLLDRSSIASVQGTSVQQAQATGGDSGDLNISQCYYVAISEQGKNLSVHLQIIQRNLKSLKRDAVDEFWEARFEREESEHESREQKREEGAEGLKPIAVRGIGDEAFWVKSGRAGTLFVRNNEKIIRLSLGGSEDETAKLEKSKTLAKQVLSRLK